MQRFILYLALLALISSSVINTSAPPSSTITTGDPTQCVTDKCPTELDSCQNDPRCPSTMYVCIDKCSGDESCLRQCVYDASLEPTFGVVTCGLKHNCFDAVDPVICVKQFCPAFLEACPSDPQCQPTLYKCYDQCKSKADCWTECISATRNFIPIVLMECAISKSCLSAPPSLTPIQCVQGKCSYQLSACQQDPKCEPTLYSCYEKCSGDQACWDQCLVGSVISQPTLDVSNCALDNQCFGLVDPLLCISQRCRTQYDACGKDPTCIPTAQKCFGICFKEKACWDNCLKGGVVEMAVTVAKCAFENNCLSL